MSCQCELCELTGRQMTERMHAIWKREVADLTPEACDVYRAHWIAERNPSPVCRHRGGQLRFAECQTCGPQVRIKVFACSRHCECTLSPKPLGVTGCLLCADREA